MSIQLLIYDDNNNTYETTQGKVVCSQNNCVDETTQIHHV